MSQNGLPLVCSVVLTFNNFADTDECLQSLHGQDYGRHQLIVVDNGSRDGSLAALKSRWEGRAQFIAARDNLGVAGGYNLGLRAALSAGADYAIACNNDIVAEPSFVRELVNVLQASANAAIAVPLIVYYDRPERVWFAKVTQHQRLGYTRNRFRDQSLRQVTRLLDATYESDFVPTCASMFSRRGLEDIGLLDERFFFGHDDVDWCLRARKKGYACVVLARPLVRHKVSVTSGVRGSNALTPASAYTHALGSVLIGAKHFRGAAALPFLFGLFAIRLPHNVVTVAMAGHWRSIPAYLKGLAVGLLRYGPGLFRPSGQIDPSRDT